MDTHINNYMQAPLWPEVVGYGSALVGLATIVAGYGSGPPGWVTIVLYYSGALSTFAGLTSTVYSTIQDCNLAKQQLNTWKTQEL
ncbi:MULTISPECIES: hypothetical protein [unclassified Paenibacillus]|uniref:hypothetical protein n=1 Tax=unclassified Paenibacillus TaxID=185978 RepID=UPI00159F85EE|nr:MULTISPECIES: hypothetical protein [unclassified Paenibacillus]